MKQSIPSNPNIPSFSRRALIRGALGSLLLPAVAKAQERTGGAEPKLFDGTGGVEAPASSERLSQVERDARTLERRLRVGKSVPIDANHSVYWSPKGSDYRFQNRTDAPLVKNGRYFEIIVGDPEQGIETSRVRPLPKNYSSADNPVTVTMSQNSQGVNEWGQDGILDSRVKPFIGKDGEMRASVTFESGHGDLIRVADTTQINANGIIAR